MMLEEDLVDLSGDGQRGLELPHPALRSGQLDRLDTEQIQNPPRRAPANEESMPEASTERLQKPDSSTQGQITLSGRPGDAAARLDLLERIDKPAAVDLA
jgi:hypothetical protein